MPGNRTHRILIAVLLTVAAHAAMAAERVEIAVHCSKPAGTIRPLHGVNGGPIEIGGRLDLMLLGEEGRVGVGGARDLAACAAADRVGGSVTLMVSKESAEPPTVAVTFDDFPWASPVALDVSTLERDARPRADRIACVTADRGRADVARPRRVRHPAPPAGAGGGAAGTVG